MQKSPALPESLRKGRAFVSEYSLVISDYSSPFLRRFRMKRSRSAMIGIGAAAAIGNPLPLPEPPFPPRVPPFPSEPFPAGPFPSEPFPTGLLSAAASCVVLSAAPPFPAASGPFSIAGLLSAYGSVRSPERPWTLPPGCGIWSEPCARVPPCLLPPCTVVG